jgi:folylpolyglutamate synthase/dihydropteroate synthase
LKSVLNEYGIASRTFATLEDAIDYSYRQLSKDDIVCIFGSLYLVGDAKNIFLP